VSCATEVALIFAWVEGLPQLGAASAVETAPAWLGMQWCQEESGDQECDGQTTPLVDKEEDSHWFSQIPCAAAGLERGTLSLWSHVGRSYTRLHCHWVMHTSTSGKTMTLYNTLTLDHAAEWQTITTKIPFLPPALASVA